MMTTNLKQKLFSRGVGMVERWDWVALWEM